MIIIINGPCGIGKSATSWALNALFERCVMLDGDYIGAIHPFEIYDAKRIAYLYQTMAHLIRFHKKEGGYANFVINYVFESADSLADLKATLAPYDAQIHVFRLIADDTAIEERIRRRESEPDELAWYLSRYKELVSIQTEAARRGDLGHTVDTTDMSVEEVARKIQQIATAGS